MYLLGTASQASIGRLGKFEPFNRAMTAAELASHFKSGVAAVDREAIAGNVVVGNDSTFETVGNWVPAASTITGGYDSGDAGHESCLRIVATATSGRAELATSNLLRVPPAGKLKKIKFSYKYVQATGMNHDGKLQFGGTIISYLSRSNTTWADVELFTIANISSPIRFYCTDASFSAGNELLVDNFTIEQVGQTASLQPTGIQLAPGQWIDQSTNAKHVIIPDGARLASPAQNGIIRRTVTWTAESIGKDILGGALAALPLNSVIEKVYLDFTSGTPVDGNLGDGSNVSRFCNSTHNSGLVSGMNQLAIDEGKNNGTNRRLIWTPVGVFTGTIKFLIKVGVIE